jgi:hypothetical protein
MTYSGSETDGEEPPDAIRMKGREKSHPNPRVALLLARQSKEREGVLFGWAKFGRILGF